MIDGMLNANVLIDLLRQTSKTLAWYNGFKGQRFAIVPIVWMEVIQGARDKREQRIIVDFLNEFQIEHPTSDDNRWAMEQFASFSLSHSIQYQDVMIASVAVRLKVPLYTFNDRHFTPLPNATVQRPY